MPAPVIPKVCRAGPIKNPGPNYTIGTTEDYPVPSPGPGEILIKNEVTGICQSDFHVANGDWGITPIVDCMGHEGAGVVVAVGEGVKGWKVGDRAGVTPIYNTCDKCEYCLNNKEALCPDRKFTEIVKNGTYTQYQIGDANFTMKLPENVPFEQLGPFMCSGGTAYTAVKNANLKEGDWVVVKGAAGGVGHMVVQFAKAQGYKVIGVDMGPERRQAALDAGAVEYIDHAATKDLVARVKELTDGKGAHGVIVVVGHPSAYEGAPALLRPAGTMVCVGLPKSGTAIAGADPNMIAFGGLTIRGILVTSRADMRDALKFLEEGKVKEHVTVMPFKDLPKAFDDVGNSRTKGRAVIRFED